MLGWMQGFVEISIHALREEGDVIFQQFLFLLKKFLSTPSARRATASSWACSQYRGIFLSTPSARRATSAFCHWPSHIRNFYPRPPRGGRQCQCQTRSYEDKFLSTPSARRATRGKSYFSGYSPISIHALREEGDRFCRRASESGTISIHALREEGDLFARRTGSLA